MLTTIPKQSKNEGTIRELLCYFCSIHLHACWCIMWPLRAKHWQLFSKGMNHTMTAFKHCHWLWIVPFQLTIFVVNIALQKHKHHKDKDLSCLVLSFLSANVNPWACGETNCRGPLVLEHQCNALRFICIATDPSWNALAGEWVTVSHSCVGLSPRPPPGV